MMTLHLADSKALLLISIVAMFVITCINGHPGGHPPEGQVRLVDGDKEGSGRVEIYHDWEWGTVCDDYWDIREANVVCQQLGFKRGISANTSTRAGSGQIWLDNVRCNGNEESLAECANNGWGASDCATDHSEDAAVQCQVEYRAMDIRLAHESGRENEGYVEIFRENRWTPLCDNSWGTTESVVLCRQLGFISSKNHVGSTSVASFQSRDFYCIGYERSLYSCEHSELSSIPNCDRENGIYVTCINYHADSATEEYYSPNDYEWTEWFSTSSVGFQGSQLTLDAIRNSFGVCIGAIPADIECRPQPKTAMTCNRRQGYICNAGKDCDAYKAQVRLLCPVNGTIYEFSTTFSTVDNYWTEWLQTYIKGIQGSQLSLIACVGASPADIECRSQTDTTVTCYPREGLICNAVTPPSVFCNYEGSEYAPGEKRRDFEKCHECTCFDNGNWKCGDYNELFCDPKLQSCNRPCDELPVNRTCLIDDWVIEWFYAGQSPFCNDCLYPYGNVIQSDENTCPNCVPIDGIPRPVAVVNRKLPGPSIQVCEGDRIKVKVINQMKHDAATGNSIHWHGMFMEGTQYMDGAFMVTQCPIPIAEAFVYDFYAIPHGTHWWHSHAGLQRGDGVNGALIVRQPKNQDPNKDYYDEDRPDHVVVVQDWSHLLSITGVTREVYGTLRSKPSTILINGKSGQTTPKSDRPNVCGEDQTEECPVPKYTQFDIAEGRRYRFRLISSATHKGCAIRVSIDQHNLTIIATDGASVEPFTCKSFIIFNAERYDFVVSANQPPGNYWMRIKGMQGCSDISGIAIIHYNITNLDIPTSKDDSSTGIKVDSCGINEPNTEPLYELNSAEPGDMDDWNSTTPNVTYYIGLNFDKVDNILKGFLPQLNNITFSLPSRPFLLQTGNDTEKEEICNLENRELEGHEGEMDICGEGFCDCSHVINIELGQVVEVIFVNEGSGACHPMHLHGTYYRVVAEESFPSNITSGVQYVKELNENGKIKKKEIRRSIQKDTMVAPENGYTVVQFRATNPGWWFFHCHFEMHLSLGMASVFHIGTKQDLPPIPENFPSCGDWHIARRGEAEAFHWSEDHLGDMDRMKNKIFKAVGQKLDETQQLLEELLYTEFTNFTVTVHRVKTDPISKDIGFHSFLFKVNTGNYNYVHLQFEVSARGETPEPALMACYINQPAGSSLFPLEVCSEDNICQINHPCHT